LELTKRTIESYLETVTVPHVIWVADNASTDGTQEWIRENITEVGMGFTLYKENLYPGRATNESWDIAVGHDGALVALWDDEGPSHFQRSDNDMEYLPGWCEEVAHFFLSEKVGQVGLRTDAEDEYAKNTGGNCVIRRELWDKGLRYDERPWPQIRQEVGDGYSEDSFFSAQVQKLGYTWTRVKRPCIRNLASGDWKDPYYQQSYGVRGIKPRRGDPTVPEDWNWDD